MPVEYEERGLENVDHQTASDEEIVTWCLRWRDNIIATGLGRERLLSSTSNLLVRLNKYALVKFGSSVTASEAANQQYACQVFDRCGTVVVPQVYRYIEVLSTTICNVSGRVGFLVMEYIHATKGTDLSPSNLSSCLRDVACAIAMMWQRTREIPGPVDMGEPRGPLWAPDNRAYQHFHSSSDLETLLNCALRKEESSIDLQGVSYVFCHLDLAARNVLVDKSTVYLIDWACAGFYPRFFEIWALRLSRVHSTDFSSALSSRLPPMTKTEEEQIHTLWQSYRLRMLHG